MSLNAEPADPQERQEHHLPPKSFADAAHEAIDHNGHDSINEDSIKETPPTRKLSRKGSIEPRPLQEMLDEEEKQPSLPSTPVQPRRTRSIKQQPRRASTLQHTLSSISMPVRATKHMQAVRSSQDKAATSHPEAQPRSIALTSALLPSDQPNPRVP
jgi:2-acylglycerol O-acyltransferase 2